MDLVGHPHQQVGWRASGKWYLVALDRSVNNNLSSAPRWNPTVLVASRAMHLISRSRPRLLQTHRSVDLVSYGAERCNEQSWLVSESRMNATVVHKAIGLKAGGPKPKQDEFGSILWWVSPDTDK